MTDSSPKDGQHDNVAKQRDSFRDVHGHAFSLGHCGKLVEKEEMTMLVLKLRLNSPAFKDREAEVKRIISAWANGLAYAKLDTEYSAILRDKLGNGAGSVEVRE